jgi:hypothetical protein
MLYGGNIERQKQQLSKAIKATGDKPGLVFDEGWSHPRLIAVVELEIDR